MFFLFFRHICELFFLFLLLLEGGSGEGGEFSFGALVQKLTGQRSTEVKLYIYRRLISVGPLIHKSNNRTKAAKNGPPHRTVIVHP